jgi:hypothetical protein
MNICAICFLDISNINNCITSCGHQFCLTCLLKSLNYLNTCPLCRTEIENKRQSKSPDISLDNIADIVYREETNQDLLNKIKNINNNLDVNERNKQLMIIARDFAIYSCISITEYN